MLLGIGTVLLVGAAPVPVDVDALLKRAESSTDRDSAALQLLNDTAGIEESDIASLLLRRADLIAQDGAVRGVVRERLAHLTLTAGGVDMDSPAALLQLDVAVLERAERVFLAAVAVDPGNLVAARNTERLRLLRAQVESARERAQQQRQQAQNAGERLDRLADEQDGQSEQSERTNPADAPSLAQQQRELEERVRQADEQLERMQQQAETAGDESLGEAVERARDSVDAARSAQKRAAGQLEQGENGQAAESQREAADALRDAAEALREGASESPQGGDADARNAGESQARTNQPGASEAGEDETGDQAGASELDPGAEALLDRERRQRELREARRSRAGRTAPVERDW
ncbi:MAG: hypothetical protein AAF995_06885 [Planctomycetota bacterium]